MRFLTGSSDDPGSRQTSGGGGGAVRLGGFGGHAAFSEPLDVKGNGVGHAVNARRGG